MFSASSGLPMELSTKNTGNSNLIMQKVAMGGVQWKNVFLKILQN